MIGAQSTQTGSDDESMTEYPHIKSLRERVYDQLERRDQDAISPATKQAAAEWLQRHREIRTMADRANGFEDFVLAYIQKEQTRYRHPPEAHSYTGQRETKLCMCGPANCPIKRGQMPRDVDEAGDVDVGIRNFRKRHQGEPVVLREARQQYAAVMAAMEEVYTQALIALTAEGEVELPDEAVELDEAALQTLEVV